jgi:coiled-coil domain-containing protein 55
MSLKYGLNIKSTKKKLPPPKPAKFAFDDEDDEDIQSSKDKPIDSLQSANREITKTQSHMSKATMQQYEDALEQDPTVFEYDEVYDDIKLREKKAREILNEKKNAKGVFFGSQLICMLTNC